MIARNSAPRRGRAYPRRPGFLDPLFMTSSPADILQVEALPQHPAPGATRMSRRALLRNWITAATFATMSAGYPREIEPFWLDEHDLPMPLRNLPKSFDGFRIIQ